MLDYLEREIGTLVTCQAELEDFVYRNLHQLGNPRITMGSSYAQVHSEYVIDVTTQPAEFPYFVVAHYDDERITMRLYYIPQSVFNTGPTVREELRSTMYNRETMAPWLTRIKEAIADKQTELNFRDVDNEYNDNQYALNNAQATWLRSEGFIVNWEKYLGDWVVKELNS